MRAVAYTLVLILLSERAASAQYAAPAIPPAFPQQASEANPPVAGPGAAAPIASLPQLYPTRQTTFLIPFTVDNSEGLPAEVQLFVSSDRGASWQMYARQRPSDGQFRFSATRDGEYWFAPKTVDQWNRVRPAGPPRPELRMLVDTLQPQLQFDAVMGRSGEVQTSWQAQDQNLLRESLRVEYQDAVGSRWQPVAIDPPGQAAPQQSYTGSITWWPDTSSRVINVRAEIQDQAGNRTVVNRRVFLTRGVAPTPSSPTTASSPMPSGAPASQGFPPSQPSQTTPFASAPRQPPAGGVPQDPFTRPSASGAVPWTVPDAPVAGNSNETDFAGTSSVPGGELPDSVGPLGDRDSSFRPISNPVNRPSLADEQRLGVPDAPQQRHYGLPPGERPRLTSSRRFGLDYDVDAVGPAGVASVELWTTTDAGRTWTRWGQDPDRTSPFDVEVEDEGIYGFRVVIVGNNGLAGRSPRAGDLADIWVGVDATAPQGRLTSAAYGQGAEAGQLVIQWTAEDDWLAPRPITLLFSDHLDGPWTTIASGLPNDGRYAWKADPRLPREIYLRLEVRDEAGNVGTYQLSDPISAEGLTPKGRIKGFRPLDP